jgi:hypothetical protein
MSEDRYIPEFETCRRVDHPDGLGFAVVGMIKGVCYGIGYRGKAWKWAWYHRFCSQCAALTWAERWFDGLSSSEFAKQARREQAKAKRAEGHGFKVGDIVLNTWGYEQTNADFYQVVRVTAKTVVVRHVESEAEPTGDMTTREQPVIDKFDGPEKRKRPYLWDGKPHLPMHSYSGCELWDGRAVHTSSYG